MNRTAAAMLLPALLLGTEAVADTATATMGVSATVARACSITSAQLLAFGAIGTTTATADSTITLTCTSANAGDTVTLEVGNGLHADTTRRMQNSENAPAFIPYTLAVGATPVELTPNSANMTPGVGQTYSSTVTGTVEPNIEYVVGSYTDTVTLIVTYTNTFVEPI